MLKILHIAKANVLRHKAATVSLFIIIAIISALVTVALSVFLEVDKDYWALTERMNSLHSVIVMPREKYRASFEETAKNDPRVSQYEKAEVLFAESSSVDYGGKVDLNLILADIEEPITISAPFMTEVDETVPRESAIYLPELARNYGYKIGDPFGAVCRNKKFDFIVAGFFETTDLALPNGATVKLYVHNEGYEALSRYLDRSVWLTIRFYDPYDSEVFNREFNDLTNMDMTLFGGNTIIMDIGMSAEGLFPVYLVAAIILLFAMILTVISLLVIRFRVTNSIENTMHEIGVLKAQGYTSRQIFACYIAEYGAVATLAAALGTVAIIPVFGVIRRVLTPMTGSPWTFGANTMACLLSALAIVLILILMVAQSARRIKKLPPVTALRGGITTNSFRRNYFPLSKSKGNVHLSLGIKNMFAYAKLYAMIGIVIAGVSLAITFMFAMYQNFVVDQTAFIRLGGIEAGDVSITVTRHTDAFALAAEMEGMPEVRKTAMMDVAYLKLDGIEAPASYISDDYSRYETLLALEGRMPVYDNEVATTKVFAGMLGKKIGDSVRVKANGVSQEYIITGYFSVLTNGGRVAAISLDGYLRLNPNYKRSGVNVYLNDGVTFDEFSETLKQRFGVLNVYREQEDSKFAAAKARAEERISFYLERYNIDSVEYAVIYDGDIILSGSSDAYQIERITDYGEFMRAAIGTYAGPIPIITEMIIAVSLIIVSLILSMTVRSVIAKRRRELGTLKSLGYTTKQLARQMAISFLPMTAVGVVIGCATGALTVSPLMGSALEMAGAQGASLNVSTLAVTVLGAVTLLITYLVAQISAMRIRHISVYELLSE